VYSVPPPQALTTNAVAMSNFLMPLLSLSLIDCWLLRGAACAGNVPDPIRHNCPGRIEFRAKRTRLPQVAPLCRRKWLLRVQSGCTRIRFSTLTFRAESPSCAA